MAKEVKTLIGVEIFAAGTWNAKTFTETDLDGIVHSFHALGLSGRIPLKLGHKGPDARDDPESQYALGWVMGVRREDARILADLEVPADVYQRVKEGRLKFVSVELLRDVKASTRVVPWVLDAVALLGTDQPAVGTLKDLQALTLMREYEFAEVATFARHEDSNQSTEEEDTDMSELSELAAKVAKLERDNDVLKAESAEGATAKRRLEELRAEMTAEKTERHRKEIKAIIEGAVREQKILPGARERFYRTHKVETDAVLEIDTTHAHEFIKENPNPDYKSERRRPDNIMSRSTDEAPANMAADVELRTRAELYCRENGMKSDNADDMVKASIAVIRAQPELGERYKNLPVDRAEAA